jgi:hypothetical protein
MNSQKDRRGRLFLEVLEARDAPAYLISAPGALSVAGIDFPGFDGGWNVQCQINTSTGPFIGPGGSPQVASLDPSTEILGPCQSPNEQDFQLLVNEFPSWSFRESSVQLAENSLQIKDYEALAPGNGAPAGSVGAALLLQYVPTGADPTTIEWVQFVSTNAPLGNDPPLIIDNAAARGAAPYYNMGGGTADDTGFYDLPCRFMSNDPIQWQADVFVAQEVTTDSGVPTLVIWGGVSWGWHTERTVVAPAVSLSSPANAAIAGTPVTLTASIMSGLVNAPSPTGTVDFYADGTLLGTSILDASGTASFDAPGFSTGTHNITAVYSGDQNYSSSQASTDQAVSNPIVPPPPPQPPSPTVIIYFAPQDQTNHAGDTVDLALTASASNGNTLIFVVNGLPSGLTVTDDGRITGVIDVGAASSTPYTVVVTVIDAATNTCVTQTFTWTVL